MLEFEGSEISLKTIKKEGIIKIKKKKKNRVDVFILTNYNSHLILCKNCTRILKYLGGGTLNLLEPILGFLILSLIHKLYPQDLQSLLKI